MAVDKPTVRASEALAGAQTLAETRGNQLVEPEHLLLSLLDQPEGVVQPIVERAGADPRALRAGAQAAVEARPSVSGANVTVEFAPAFRAVVRRAGEEAATLQDEYISTEHLLLALVEDGGTARQVLLDAGVTRESLMNALRQVRGSARVTDPNPEEKYQSLEKYGRDLTNAAAEGKLDPVIGRDEEVRRVIQVLSRRTKNNPV
ncbi:MAG: type VI secretion system ATPase TssH, partial [Actinomycetota bacterium]|nr:type VI secretion system ATPase TssH [Actinomycetota bacterium]